MAIALTVTPGKRFQSTEKVTIAKLNLLGTPTVSLDGAFGPADLTAADYSALLTAGAYFYGLDTGVANAAVVALTPAPANYVDGLLVAFKVLVTNTGAVTLNANGLGPRPVYKNFNQPLTPGDWRAGQIVVCRYRLDTSIVPVAATYTGGGTYTQAVVPGQTYTWTPGTNDLNLVNGAQTLVAAGGFTAQGATVTLNGTLLTGVTATVIPASNVWQMLSQLGNPPTPVVAMRGATPYKPGTPGLVPGAPALVNGKVLYLGSDAGFHDVVAAANAAAQASIGTAYVEIYKARHFN